MNIVHVLHEVPYPPKSGIRCDMWRRQIAFNLLGNKVFSISWASMAASEMPSAAERYKMSLYATESVIFNIRSGFFARLKRVANLLRYPSYVASRIPSNAERADLIERISKFSPDIVWLEGVHAQLLAREIASRFSIPLIYRSHNIEYLYVAEQSRLSRSLRTKLALMAGTFHLRRMEESLHRDADHVFDISNDDLEFWRQKGLSNNSWLAPLSPIDGDDQVDPPRLSEKLTIDLLYVGGLQNPNNEAGLRWYFSVVHQLIVDQLPTINVVIAGRNPSESLSTLIRVSGASVIANPQELQPLYDSSSVIMNPILHGSGVNIKTVDMLASGCHLVSTSKGTRGLPAEILKYVAVADTPSQFAEAVVKAIIKARTGSNFSYERNNLVRQMFGVAAVERALAVEIS